MDDEPSYEISVSSAQDADTPVAPRLRDAVTATLRRHNAAAARINVALVDDETIATLNEKHMNHAGPTDVLTFDLRDDDAILDSTSPVIDGEIVVSTETAAREAADRGHDEHAELALYAVHGTLHLLGYDDKEDAQALAMHRLEDEILSTIGFGYVYEHKRL